MTPSDHDPDEDPFDDAAEAVDVEPEIEDVEPETEKPADEEVGKTPASIAVETESADRRAELLALAHQLDVRSDDPAWLLVKAALDAQGAASVAQDAASKLTDLPSAIERASLEGASQAAAEIKQHAAAGARAVIETMSVEIEKAAAVPVAKAMRPHIKTICDQAGEIAKTLRITENERIEASADQFMQRVTKRIDAQARATTTGARVVMLFAIALGAAAGIAGTKLDHRLSPTPIRSTSGGGYSIRVPSGYGGKFRHCGGHECVYLYPPRGGGQGAGK